MPDPNKKYTCQMQMPDAKTATDDTHTQQLEPRSSPQWTSHLCLPLEQLQTTDTNDSYKTDTINIYKQYKMSDSNTCQIQMPDAKTATDDTHTRQLEPRGSPQWTGHLCPPLEQLQTTDTNDSYKQQIQLTFTNNTKCQIAKQMPDTNKKYTCQIGGLGE